MDSAGTPKLKNELKQKERKRSIDKVIKTDSISKFSCNDNSTSESPEKKLHVVNNGDDSVDAFATPSLSKDEAETILSSLELPPAPKKQSQYVRFKRILLTLAKKKDNTEVVKNITKVAKECWERIKHNSVLNESFPNPEEEEKDVSITDRSYLLWMKKTAYDEEYHEMNSYRTKLREFSNDFLLPAIALIQWYTVECTIHNLTSIQEKIQNIHTKATTIFSSNNTNKSGSSSSSALDIPSEYEIIYQQAQKKIQSMEEEFAIQQTVHTLRNASDDTLFQHARNYHQLLSRIQDLTKIETQYNQLLSKQSQRDDREASSIKSEIIASFRKQMVYTSPSLKYSWKKISFSRKGVTSSVFEKAFDVVKPGVKVVILDSTLVGTKPLRYGYLSCKNVRVSLKGDVLSASTQYGI